MACDPHRIARFQHAMEQDMHGYCKRCSFVLSKEEKTCPNCGIESPAVAPWSFWQDFRRNGIWALAFLLLGIVAWLRFERASVGGTGGALFLAAVAAALPAAFLFIFGKPRWALPFLYLATALALVGLLSS